MTITVASPTDVDAPLVAAHTSVSGLGDAARCLKLYELKRIRGLPETPGAYLAGGSAVHDATEMYDRMLFTMSGR